jgi:hypothetical protein
MTSIVRGSEEFGKNSKSSRRRSNELRVPTRWSAERGDVRTKLAEAYLAEGKRPHAASRSTSNAADLLPKRRRGAIGQGGERALDGRAGPKRLKARADTVRARSPNHVEAIDSRVAMRWSA